MSDLDQPTPTSDERIKEFSKLRKALIRPELGGIVGTVAVFTFFLLFTQIGFKTLERFLVLLKFFYRRILRVGVAKV